MEKCIEFCLNIGKFEDLKNINDNEIINKLKENVSKSDGILFYIQRFLKNYGQIRMFQDSLSLKYIVQGIFNSSTYFLSNNEKDKFKCTYIDKEKNKQVELKMEDIKRYKERALLPKKTRPDYKYFIETITEIINISNILEKVSMERYPDIITIKMNLKVKVINKNDKEIKIEPTKEYYLDNDNSKKDYQEIRENLNNILSDCKTRQIQFNLLSNIKLISKYFVDFYPNIHSEDIKKIQKIIVSLEDNDLNYFEKYYKKDYDKYIKYLNEAENSLEKRSNEFYNIISIDSKKTYEKDDLKCLEETENKFNKLRNLFEENGIDKIDEKILALCSKLFNKKEIEISSQIKKLIKIFKVPKENYNIDNLKNDILLISKREYILNAASSLIFFIDQTGARKGDYSSRIKKIMTSLKENTNISSLKQNIEQLQELDLDLINEGKNYINILIKLSQKEEIIKFLFNITIQDCHNLKEILSENNYSFITLDELSDIEKCVEFFKSLGNLDDLKLKYDEEIIKLFKENVSKTENEKIIMNFYRFVDNFNKIKDLQSSLFESFIKLTKHLKGYSSSNLLDNLKIDNQLLFDQNIKEKDKDKDNDMNYLRIDKSENLSSDKIDFSLIFFFKEGLKFFRVLTNLFKNNNNINIIDYKTFYEKKNKELNEKISILKLDLEKEKEIKNKLNLKIKELEILLKDKEKEISERKLQINDLINKINDIKDTSNGNKIIELL